MQEGQFVSTGDKELFLDIDGVEKLMEEYCNLLEKKASESSHTIIFYGDTGCGKRFFSNECIKKVKEKNEEVIEIDLLDHFKSSNYASEKKLYTVLEMIEYELISHGAFDDLKGKSENPEMFKRILEKMLKEKNITLLIRFPQIEVFDEIEKYYAYLCNRNTIIYFITEKKTIVSECRKKLERNIKYFECMRLKQGDGKLVIDNCFSKENHPKFEVDDVESLMSKRPINNKMTIKELKNICDKAYVYAKENNIDCITKSVIMDALANNSII